MKKTKILRSIAVVLILMLAFSVLAGCSSSQPADKEQGQKEEAKSTYPNKPITVYIQYAAGGATDQTCRALAAEVEKEIGAPINSVNMPGATGAVATSYVLGQPHDGYSLVGMSDNIRIYQAMDLGDMSYKDFHMWIAGGGVAAICVRKDSPIKTMEDFVNKLKEKDKDFTVSTSGMGNAWHTSLEMLNKSVGGDYKVVIYNGGRPALVGCLNGEVEATVVGLMEVIEFVRSGDLRVLATFNDKSYEIEGVGSVPSVGEYAPEIKPVLPFGGWWGFGLPKDAPQEVVDAIDKAYEKAKESQKLKDFFKNNYFVYLGYGREESEKMAARETPIAQYLLWDLGVAKKDPAKFGYERPDILK